jgi:phosphoribosyl 1,2-cyclic phosphodiesterase
VANIRTHNLAQFPRLHIDAALHVCNHLRVIAHAPPAHRHAERTRISLRVSILASGSTGNCTLLETECTTLLIDAGIGRRELQRRFEALGRARPERVDGILVTHEHTDHSSAVAQLARDWDCPAYLTEPTYREMQKMYDEDFSAQGLSKQTLKPGPDAASDGEPKPEQKSKPSAKTRIDHIQHIRPGMRFAIGDIEVSAFAIPHDAADPVGYSFRVNGTKVAIVTDLGYMPELVKHHIREADLLILESNHDLDMLKVGPYPWYIKQRVMGRTGHLSNTVVSEFLADCEVFDGRARYLVLAHLSEQNNTPDLARICAEEALGRRAPLFQYRGDLHIASQRTPLGPFEL